MNVFEFIAFAVACAVAYLFGSFLAAAFGPLGWLVGIIGGFSFIFFGINALRKLVDIWHEVRPLRPVCRAGKCNAEDYDYEKTLDEGVVFICRCGNRYLLSKGRFMEILSDGSWRPFMKRDWLGRWKPDNEAAGMNNPNENHPRHA